LKLDLRRDLIDGERTFASEALEMKELVLRQFNSLTFAPFAAVFTADFHCRHRAKTIYYY